MPGRIIVFDPGMGMRMGHHFSYNQCIQKAFAPTGVPVTILCNLYAQPDITPEFDDCRAVVPGVHYLPDAEEPLYGQDYANRVAVLFTALHEHVTPMLDEGAILFSHTSRPFTLKALDLWSRGLPYAIRPHMFFNLHGYKGGTRFIKDLQEATLCLKNDPKAHLLGSYTGIANRLSKITGMRAGVLPAPLELPDSVLKAERPGFCPGTAQGPPLERVIFGFAGEGRASKQMSVLPVSMLEYLAKGGKGAFHFSFYPMDDEAMSVAVHLNEMRKKIPQNLVLSTDYLEPEDYYAAMAKLHCLLITYGDKSQVPSGVLQEAMAMGLPVILPGRGVMYDEISTLGGGFVPVSAITPEALSGAMFEFERNREELSAKAAALAIRYRSFHSADNLVRLLCNAPDALTII